MPYSMSNLPANVKKLDAKHQRQWMHVFNSCTDAGKPESTCFASANGVVKRSKGVDLTADEVQLVEAVKSYQYVDSWEYNEVQLTQEEANYDAIGGLSGGGKACANCQWFLPPGRCAVVAGPISPTGLSDLWRAETPVTPTPIPVTIVSGDIGSTIAVPVEVVGSSETAAAGETVSPKGTVARAMSALKSALGVFSSVEGAAPLPLPVLAEPMTLLRQKDGRMRFLTAWSNNFQDREKEIFTEAAHKEFIEWADANQQYPELWIWHTKDTKYGQVDWLDYTDGFVFASGLIDVGKEGLAERIAKEDTGVSHGFTGLLNVSAKEYVHYRSWEISTLPRQNAAVWTTSFNIATEGTKEVPFTEAKKTYLKEHGLSDEQIAAAEIQAANLFKALNDAGVGYKDADLEPVVAAPPAPAAAPAPTTAEKAAPPAFETTVTEQLSKLTDAVVSLATSVKSVDDRVKTIEGDTDGRVAAAITPRSATTVAVQASKDDSNIVPGAQKVADDEWFGKIVGNLTGSSVG